MIDTPWTNELTALLCQWVNKNLASNVTSLVVTHAHIDYMGGLAEVLKTKAITYRLDRTAKFAAEKGEPVPANTFRDKLHVDLREHKWNSFSQAKVNTVQGVNNQ